MRSRTRLAAGLAVLVTGLTGATATAATAPLPGNTGVPPVHAKAETPPLFDDDPGHNSNADDPAVWYDARHPGASLVLGTAGQAIDGSEETDGIAALSRPLGDAFPHGVFVSQDGYNAAAPGTPDDGDRTDTNYKISDLSDVMRAAGVR